MRVRPYLLVKILSFNGSVIHLRLFVGRLELEYNGAQAVVATANGNARFSYPVAVVKYIGSHAVGEGERVLVNSLPRLVAKTLGL